MGGDSDILSRLGHCSPPSLMFLQAFGFSRSLQPVCLGGEDRFVLGDLRPLPLDGRGRDPVRGRRWEEALTFGNFPVYKNKPKLPQQFDLSQCSELHVAPFMQYLRRKVLIFPLHLEASLTSKDTGSAHPLKVTTPIEKI